MPRRVALNAEEAIHSVQPEAGEISSWWMAMLQQFILNKEDTVQKTLIYWSRVLSSESGLLKQVIIF